MGGAAEMQAGSLWEGSASVIRGTSGGLVACTSHVNRVRKGTVDTRMKRLMSDECSDLRCRASV